MSFKSCLCGEETESIEFLPRDKNAQRRLKILAFQAFYFSPCKRILKSSKYFLKNADISVKVVRCPKSHYSHRSARKFFVEVIPP